VQGALQGPRRRSRDPDQADEAGSFTAVPGTGLPTCNDTGYKGRVALYEVMNLERRAQGVRDQRASSTVELKREAIRLGMMTLRASALNKLREGVTTIEEVTRVARRTEDRDGQPAPAPQGMVEKGASDLHITTGSRPSCASTASWCRSRCRR
jgi:hypothetical protein